MSGWCPARASPISDTTSLASTRTQKIRMLSGGVPIYEPGLEPLTERNCREGRFDFTTYLKDAARDVDVVNKAIVPEGTSDERAAEVMPELYRSSFINETPIVFTSRRTSELTK